MIPYDASTPTCRWGGAAAMSTLLGVVLSGPAAVLVLAIVRPQPPWKDAEQFARHYHGVQALPYFGGFLLIFGFVALSASLCELAPSELKARATTALVFTAAFAALVLLNYVLQTTFVPNLARHYTAENAPLISTFSMANPSSLAWALEMWAYGFLGVGHWLIAPVFTGTAVEKTAKTLFVTNGVVSTIAALASAFDPGWLMTTTGAVGYASWNLLVLAMVGFAWAAFRQRIATSARDD